jgi:hypothetical protein
MQTNRILRSGAGKMVIAALSIGAGLVGARAASGDPIDDDGAPSGMVAFVSGGKCPLGWAPAANVEGRLVVGVTDGKNVGVQVGDPLADQEDRAHSHAYAGELALPEKAIAGGDGANNTGAAAQAYSISGKTEAGASGLPFVQVQACVKQ